MSDDRERFNKIIAIAVNPATYEEEAVAALRKARELVKQNRSLAHPPPLQPAPPRKPRPPDYSFELTLTNIPPFWIQIVADKLSCEANCLGLKNKIEYDFCSAQTALDVRVDGPKIACDFFQLRVDWLVNYVNSQLRAVTPRRSVATATAPPPHPARSYA
jgi:hypothetical protein